MHDENSIEKLSSVLLLIIIGDTIYVPKTVVILFIMGNSVVVITLNALLNHPMVKKPNKLNLMVGIDT